MKSLVILGCFVALSAAQRPSYAGTSQKVYPELASRFKDTSSSSNSVSSIDSSSNSNSLSGSSIDTNVIGNRIGETDPQTTIKIPVDARGDEELVRWLNSWPRENRPFWLLNAEHIEKFRDPQGTRNKQQEVRLRSSFEDDDDDSSVESRDVPTSQQRLSLLRLFVPT